MNFLLKAIKQNQRYNFDRYKTSSISHKYSNQTGGVVTDPSWEASISFKLLPENSLKEKACLPQKPSQIFTSE